MCNHIVRVLGNQLATCQSDRVHMAEAKLWQWLWVGEKSSYWPASLSHLVPVSSHHLWRRFRDWIDTLAENGDLRIYYGCYLWISGVSSVVSICWL